MDRLVAQRNAGGDDSVTLANRPHRRRRLPLTVGTSFAMALLAILPGTVAATYTRNLWNGFYAMQQTDYYCVPASAQMTVDYITGSRDNSKATQDTYYSLARAHDKEPHVSGSDPRGWSYLLWFYNNHSEGWNDYKYASQGVADYELELGIREAQEVSGALVAAGHHAYNVVGFQASRDPGIYVGTALYGFYVVDPWFGRPDGIGSLPGGPYNLAPNTYRTLAQWNSSYLLKYTADTTGGQNQFWHNQYVVVVRAPTDLPPSDSQSTGTTYADQFAPGNAIVSPPDPEYPAGDLAGAVLGGLASNGLVAHNQLGLDLRGVSVGPSVKVDSLIAEFPSYDLVTLQRNGKTVAVAVVVLRADGLHFAELAAATPGYVLPDPASAATAFQSHLVNPRSMTLVWAWTAGNGSPFEPFYQAVDGAGRTTWITPSGFVRQLSVLPEMRLRSGVTVNQ